MWDTLLNSEIRVYGSLGNFSQITKGSRYFVICEKSYSLTASYTAVVKQRLSCPWPTLRCMLINDEKEALVENFRILQFQVPVL